MEDGTEVRLYDLKREPPEWTGIVLGTQCAVFLSDISTSEPLSREGKPFPNAAEATCLVFDSLDAAQRFCQSTVDEHPNVRCEVFDSQGRAHPPMLVVIHPSQQRLDHPGAAWSRRRKRIAALLLTGAVPMFWIGWRSRGAMILPTFLGISMMLIALRFLHWDFGLKHAQREREKRLEEHRRRERASDTDSA